MWGLAAFLGPLISVANASSLLPREHGAYAELGFPLLTGLTLARPTVTGAFFALSAVAWFLAHEPLAVTMGLRGARLLAAEGSRARRRARVLVALGTAAGTLALAMAQPPARWAAVIPLGAVALLLPAVMLRRQKTLWAETLVILAFAGMVLPVGMAAGVPWRTGWRAAGVWCLSFVLGTIAVHALKVRHKRGPAAGWLLRVPPVLAVACVMAALGAAAGGRAPWPLAVAIVPPALVAMVIGIVRVHPRYLRRVGWSLLAANAVTWACLLNA